MENITFFMAPSLKERRNSRLVDAAVQVQNFQVRRELELDVLSLAVRDAGNRWLSFRVVELNRVERSVGPP